MRPTRVQTFMELAHVWSKRATCFRLNVGAVVVVNGTAISHGYNGAPAGHAHCTGNDCPGKLRCQQTVHAEVNAIKRVPEELKYWGSGILRNHDKITSDIYCTDSPCPDCAELIYETGIKRVFFATPYRITDALDALIEQGVEVYRVTPAGYVIEWKSGNVIQMD